ncbi:transcriptional regulator (plasmid) [Chloroflexota bacterium]|nr:transcriptional regulator [Chloroflexota bacterium]
MKNQSPLFDVLLMTAEIDKTVHEPARLMILSMLNVVDSADFTFLLHQTGLTRGNFSTHIRKLEEAAYVAVKKEFVDNKPLTTYSITEAGRQALSDYRKLMEKILIALE